MNCSESKIPSVSEIIADFKGIFFRGYGTRHISKLLRQITIQEHFCVNKNMQIIFFSLAFSTIGLDCSLSKQLSLINHDIRGHFYARTSEYAGFFLTLYVGP